MADNKRLRVSKACDSCRRKKKRGPPKGYIEAIEARLHRMEGLLGGLIKDKDPRADIVKAELDAMAREAEMTGLKLRRSKAYEEINNAMAAFAASGSTSSTAGFSQSFSSAHDTSSSDSRKYSVAGQQHNQPLHVHQQQQHFQPRYADNRSPSPRLPAAAIQNARSSISNSSKYLLNSMQAVILPSIDVMDHLMNIHFRFVHPVLPMLHQKTLLDQIHRKEPIPSHFLFAVLGLASRFSDNPIFRDPQPGADRPPCTVFYERAKVLIKDEYDHSQIMTVQALLLMSIQQMGFCESQRAWLYVGMAIRMAQDLGLNKELSEQEQSRNRLGAELRRRTWWSCYVVDRLVCAGLGRPLTITKQECEIGYPQYDDEDNDRSASTMLAEPPTLIPNFIHLITLSRVQGQILQFIKARAVECDESNDGHSPNPNSTAFSTLDKSLAEWRQTLPESLQTPTRKSPHFGLFLHMTYNTSIILLHRPEFFFSATSASLCTQAAATITEITEILMKAKVLSSMFISCLYAIFSAGLIHFINIPSVKRSSCSSSVSPTVPSTHGGSINHALTAKTDLKRCIDALKHVSTHWISAARRAKVLEDLLDLKHVSLKGLEE
ncbi:fungal-specific transcription factor domain-containing protein, partial [Dissophora ornata]